jgi:hypothetical protein
MAIWFIFMFIWCFVAIWCFGGHLVHFMAVWYIFPVLVCCIKKNLATQVLNFEAEIFPRKKMARANK